ncbi:hypothetical protein ONZ43_g7054 [Nemania bipapillata]|uniref:Uncharacterized protein n=1 Tax=Nemania bipapillata TaxID=110536 RepID=A0ACC2HUN8_9PEZI|nr:hypothetical protein ONZ43_g7054 [Nemania bipapillata]
MRKRLFWFDHSKPENKADPTQPLGTSHTNDFEVEMVAATVSHLVRQGVYSHDQIAVLTPYLGQLHKLKKRLGNSFEIVLGDRDTGELDRQGLGLDLESAPDIQKKSLGKCLTLATVDNFQGEEAEVVVISLVRSNPDGRCGFLRTSNRINVLLSRAKHGMYIFGNSATYAQVQMWSDIIAHAHTHARGLAIQAKTALLAKDLAIYNVITVAVVKNAQSPVRLARSRRAFLPVRIASVQCRALRRVIGFLARCDVQRNWHAVINVHHFAEKFALNLNIANMDGQLRISEYYDIDENGRINGIKELGEFAQVKSCPTCRGSLRNLSRYGRIVRQALLEESTKKFITWSHTESMDFENRLLDEQERLENLNFGKEILVTIGRQGQLRITGQRLHQLLSIAQWVGYGRYDPILRLYREIARYVHHVAIEEQPYQRVHDLVQHSRRRGIGSGQFLLNPSKLETRGLLLAGSLLLRCDLLILKDFMALRRQAQPNLTTILIDLATTLGDCDELIRLAKEKKYVRHETEGHIYFIQFAALVRSLFLEKLSRTFEESEEMDRMKARGEEHLAKARVLLDHHKESTSHLVKEFEIAELMLIGARYTPISMEEKRAIWLAMSKEFSGTGHWYACENGHPFTVGECGMPMEQTRCPECGAAVGGWNHQAAQGVYHDADMDALGTATGDLLL